ncbi:MAG TPA: AraC family transcriptional regulator [Polyangia bacterium]|nr:AraC family transcriptional regulator [Polyangia bacterium]
MRPRISQPAPAPPRSNGTGTVSTEYLRLMALGMETCGLSLAPIFAATGIDPAILDRRGARVPHEPVEQVWAMAAEQLGDPSCGLAMVEALPFGAGDLLDYLILSSATVADALTKLTRYEPLLCDSDRSRVVVSGNLASIRFGSAHALPYPREMVVGLFARRSREMFGPTWSLKHVSFTHEPLGPAARYERVFQVPVYFGMPVDEAVFARDLLQMPMQAADARLNAILTDQAEGLLSSIAPPPPRATFVETVQQAVRHGLTEGNFTLTRLAEHLGMSARTLQRRLQGEGLTHRELVRGLRHDLAARALDAPVSQGQIARALGYSGAGSFHRAFKSWAGMTPGEQRGGRPRTRRARPRSGSGESPRS